MRLLFMLLPWLELLTLIQLGIATSALAALAWVFVTIVLGMALLQRQGRDMFAHLRQAQDGRVIGSELLVDDMVVGLSGLLLLIPGLITDVAAVIVLMGPLRRRIARRLFPQPPEPYVPQKDAEAGETLEGSFRRLDD